MENYLPTIRIGHLRVIDHLILGMSHFRLENGGSQKLEAALEPVPMNAWEQVADALLQDRIHGAFMTLPLALDLFGAGAPLRCLMLVHRSGSLVVRTKGIQCQGLSGFKGKSVLVPARLSVQTLLLHRFLAGAGLSFGDGQAWDVNWEPAPPFLMPEMMAADTESDIGGFMTSEPFGTLALDRGLADLVCTSDSLWQDHPCCGFVVSQKATDGQEKMIEQLVAHFFESARRLHKSPDADLAPLAADFLGQDLQTARKAVSESGISFDPDKLVPHPALLDQIQTYMTQDMDLMPHPVDPDTFLDPEPALKAASELSIEN